METLKFYGLNALVIIIVFTLTNFITSLISYLLGDKAVKEKGFLTLNPVTHFEPIGFILMFLCGYGWAKPVQTNSLYYKDRKTGAIITYLIPIIFNVLTGMIIYRMFNGSFMQVLGLTFIKYGLFNIIPVYPLCGYRILQAFLGPNGVMKLSGSEKLWQVVLLFAIFFGVVGNAITYLIGFLI